MIVCVLMSLISVAITMLIVAFSHNRVEGMALAKLSGVVLLGLPVPFFLSSGVQYLFSGLPSFWVAKLCTDGNTLDVIPAVFVTLVWIWALYGKFQRKLL
jgi:fluoroquinolone transport system permease protein